MKVEDLSPTEARHALFAQGILGPWLLDAHQIVVYDLLKALPSSTNEALVFCSRQWGKSFLNQCMALEWLLETAFVPGVKPRIARVAAPKKNQCEEIVEAALDPILQWAPKGLVVRDRSRLRWRIGKNSLRLGAAERAHVDTLRGGNAGLVVMEEGGFVDSEDYAHAVKSVIGPQLLRSGGRLVHVTTPSEDEGHYIHTEIIPKTKLTGSYFSYDIYTNTALSPAEIAKAMTLAGGEKSEAWRREYLCEIVRSPSLVAVPEFDEKEHVREFKLPQFFHAVVAADLGGLDDKSVGLFVAYDFKNGRTLFWEESAHDPNTSTREIVKGLKALEDGPHGVFVRHRAADAPGQLRIDLREEHGWEASLPPKDDWEASLRNFRHGVQTGRVWVHPRCRLLVQTLRWGLLNKQRNDFARSKTLGHCDALAAAMYGYRVIQAISHENPFPKEFVNPATTRVRQNTEEAEALVRMAKLFERADRRRKA